MSLDLAVCPQNYSDDDRRIRGGFDLARGFELGHGRLHQVEARAGGKGLSCATEAKTELRAFRIVARPELVRLAVETSSRGPGRQQPCSVAGLAKREPCPLFELGILTPGGPRVLER